MENVKCAMVNCDHNTGYTKECMYGVTPEIIESATTNVKMCEHLRNSLTNEIYEKGKDDGTKEVLEDIDQLCEHLLNTGMGKRKSLELIMKVCRCKNE